LIGTQLVCSTLWTLQETPQIQMMSQAQTETPVTSAKMPVR